MTGIRFNIRQRRFKNNKKEDGAVHDADRDKPAKQRRKIHPRPLGGTAA